jgi:phosphonate transport system ATP-binding protein
MIKVSNITKSTREGTQILKGISFKVKKGEFVGILGPSGAGKTLTMRCMSGLTQPTTGDVTLVDGSGKSWNITNCEGRNLRKVRQKIGNIFQGSNLVKRMTVLDNVMIGRLGSINIFRSLIYGFNDQEAKEALAALEKVKIAHLAYRIVGSLSGGEMQRVAISRALFQNPIIMLADEPISSLDPSNSKKIMKILQSLSQEMPIIGVFHQPEITAKYCTRIIAIKDGKIVYDGDSRLSNKMLTEIYGSELSELEQYHSYGDEGRTASTFSAEPLSF